ncbi:hypothetical protein [Dyella sp. GSA-30]|uniref:hypothetical protein n=1 Tax=Dyella sp. GSA-30 TaxID=2994496 RepID=UPI002490FF7A|nr:hypothetical protein [Dyella sp. GSA-30]BDU18614.1 hypothetical protein DYGSA30_00710 [Dyella sp. GSA-30]
MENHASNISEAPNGNDPVIEHAGTCALCDAPNVALAESHIIPKFVYDWLKKTSPTPYVRYSSDVNSRQQDGPKEHLLCFACEQKLSALEKTLASRLFKKIANYQKQKSIINVNSNLRLAVLSIFWRTILTARNRESSRTNEDNEAMGIFIESTKTQILNNSCNTKIYLAPFFGDSPYYNFDAEKTYFLERGIGCQDIRFMDDPHRFFAVFKLPFMFFYIFSEGWPESELVNSSELLDGEINVEEIKDMPDILREYIEMVHEDFEKLKKTMNQSSLDRISNDMRKSNVITGAHKSLGRSRPKPR